MLVLIHDRLEEATVDRWTQILCEAKYVEDCMQRYSSRAGWREAARPQSKQEQAPGNSQPSPEFTELKKNHPHLISLCHNCHYCCC